MYLRKFDGWVGRTQWRQEVQLSESLIQLPSFKGEHLTSVSPIYWSRPPKLSLKNTQLGPLSVEGVLRKVCILRHHTNPWNVENFTYYPWTGNSGEERSTERVLCTGPSSFLRGKRLLSELIEFLQVHSLNLSSNTLENQVWVVNRRLRISYILLNYHSRWQRLSWLEVPQIRFLESRWFGSLTQ